MYLKLKGQKMHFLVNAYSPKPLILVTSNVKIYNLVNAVLGLKKVVQWLRLLFIQRRWFCCCCFIVLCFSYCFRGFCVAMHYFVSFLVLQSF